MNPMPNPGIVTSITAEFHRYKAIGDGALAQLDDAELTQAGSNGGNSIAVLVWHISGNLASRFTDFLTTDGEKPWRNREEEFVLRNVTRAEVLKKWEDGWAVLLNTLSTVSDADLRRSITIRGQPLLIQEALLRSLAHVSYHVGQIVYVARSLRGNRWTYLSIPPGGSAAYNQNPDRELPAGHTDALRKPKQ